jgi:hypothetical protein
MLGFQIHVFKSTVKKKVPSFMNVSPMWGMGNAIALLGPSGHHLSMTLMG